MTNILHADSNVLIHWQQDNMAETRHTLDNNIAFQI